MVIDEAIRIIEDKQGKCELIAVPNYEEAFDIALDAMKKQVPKKLHYDRPTKVKAFDGESHTVAIFDCVPCSVCGKWITANLNHKYCQYCGQALDWGKSD